MSLATEMVALSSDQTKICRSCHKILPLSDFTKCHFSYYADCKKCCATKKRKRYAEDACYRSIQLEASKATRSKAYSTTEGRYKALLATQRHRASGSLSLQQWLKIVSLFHDACAYCGATGELEQDHIIAIAKRGTTTLGNVVPACRRCNASKGTKELVEWYKSTSYYNEDKLTKVLAYMEGAYEASL